MIPSDVIPTFARLKLCANKYYNLLKIIPLSF